MNPDIADPATNKLLLSLPRDCFLQFRPLLKTAPFQQGAVLHEPGNEVETVYFPHTGMISLLAVMRDDRAIETATVGCEGIVGGMSGLGLHTALTRATVQLPLVASQISAASFRKAVQSISPLRDLIVRANDALLAQVQITAACNALHPIEERLARWVLQSADRMHEPLIPLTQELLSQMLGVNRSTVSEIASKFQNQGLIQYSRGSIKVVDRTALEKVACECYETIRTTIF